MLLGYKDFKLNDLISVKRRKGCSVKNDSSSSLSSLNEMASTGHTGCHRRNGDVQTPVDLSVYRIKFDLDHAWFNSVL